MSQLTRGGALASLIVLCFFSWPVSGDHHPATSADDVEVMRSGGINMYRYRDKDGQMVVVDRPPPQFFKVEEDDAVVDEVIEAPAIVEAAPPVVMPEKQSLVPMLLWLLTLSLVIAALVLFAAPFVRRWRRETPVDRALRLAELPVFRDVKVSISRERFAMAERIVRTPAGILVLGIAKLKGQLRGAADAQQWIRGTTPVANPVKPVDHAVAYVEQLVPDVPVMGGVVDLGNATFAMGAPKALHKLDEFRDGLKTYNVPGPATRSLDSAWRTLMKLQRSNGSTTRLVGSGPLGWVRRNPHQAGAAALGALALMMAVTLLIAQAL